MTVHKKGENVDVKLKIPDQSECVANDKQNTQHAFFFIANCKLNMFVLINSNDYFLFLSVEEPVR